MKILCVIFSLLEIAFAQEVPSNDAVIKMVNSGLGDDRIVNLIQTQTGNYSTTADDLAKLKQQGASEKVLNAIRKQSSSSAPGSDSVVSRAYQRRQEAAETARGKVQSPSGGPTTPSPARGAESGANNTFFVTWRDPREDAFQVGVPQGWQVGGGLMKVNPNDPHGVVRAQSPNGNIQIFIDDPDLHPHQVPDQTTQFAGKREGQFLQSPSGGSILLARYQTGTQFAQSYVRTKLCRRPMINDAAELRELTRQMNAILQPFAMQQRAIAQGSLGETVFQCGGSAGYVMAGTFYVRAMSGGVVLWFVSRLGGYLVSDPQQAGLAYYVLNTMFETLKTNPRWEARNAQQAHAVNSSVAQMQSAMAQSIAQYGQRQAASASAGGFNHPNSGALPTDLRKKWASEDASRQRTSDATLGQTWMHSSNGANVRVDNSSSYWWRDNSGNVVAGPASGAPPTGSQGQWEKLTPGWQQ